MISQLGTYGLRAGRTAMALLLVIGLVIAAPAPAMAQVNPNPIDWTIVDTFVGPANNQVPLRVGQADFNFPGIGRDGFGVRHIVGQHGVVPPGFDIQETILGDCVQSPNDGRIRCHNPNSLLFVVYQPLVDERSGDNLPFGIITAFYMLPGCLLGGRVPAQDCPSDPLPSGLAYTGPTSAHNGDSLTVSAFLHDDLGTQLPGRSVSFALGTGGGAQTCSATTDSAGVASCTIDPVDQPPGPAVPLEASFAGGAGFEPASVAVELAIASATRVDYTGEPHLANGTGAALTAVLTDAHLDQPLPDRELTFTLGDDQSQTCAATTDAAGLASCTIDPVDQPLTADATVPVYAAFDGDPSYLPSADQAQLLLEYYTGAAFGISASVNLPLLPSISLPSQPDTGAVRTAHPQQTEVECTATIDTLLITVGGLCPTVSTTLAPGTIHAVSEVAEATVELPGVATIGVSGLTAEATSSCASTGGRTTLELTINGEQIEISGQPNQTIGAPLGTVIVVNEQQPAASGDGITVTGVRISGVGGLVDIVLAHTESAAHHCPTQ